MTAKIKLNAASGGGSFSLQAPSSSANNRVFTIPDVADGTIATTATAGKILQVVNATTTTTAENTTETFADTGLTATISISANSKVLILTSMQLDVSRSSSVDAAGSVKLLRGSTDIFAPSNTKSFGFEGASSTKALYITLTSAFLDTGASTGSNTYKTQFRVKSASSNAKIRINDDNSPSTMTLMEIAA